MKNICLSLLLISVLCTACAGDSTPPPVSSPTAEAVLEASATPLALQPTATLTPFPPTTTPSPSPTAPPAPISLELSPQEFTFRGTFQAGLGDLDGDGDLDAVFANTMGNNSTVWLNDGSGLFVDTGQALTTYGHGVGLADFDADGDLDAFIVCHQFTNPSRVYLNDGSGSFTDSAQDLGDARFSAAEVNLLDLNGDGHTDVHVLYYDPSGLPDKVYLNDGQAVFTDSGLALDEETIAWGDLDGDGDVDYFGKRWGVGYNAWFNDGSGQFSLGWQMDQPQTTVGSIALADFDADGDLDALVVDGHRDTGSFPSRLLLNDGRGQFTDSGQGLNLTLGAEPAPADLDGDGDLDVLIANMDIPGEIWLNDGTGQLLDSGLRLGEANEMNGKPSLGDLDGDGDLDVVLGKFTGSPQVWLNTSSSNTASSPAGLIAFYSNRDGNQEIYIMHADGSAVTRLTDDPAFDDSPAISPDGSQVAFLTARHDPLSRFPNLNYEIYLVDSDGSNLRRLTTTDAAEDHPAWSPDGSKILFDADYDADGFYEIYHIQPDGTNLVRLTEGQFNDQFADWSPDGTHIAFSSARNGNWDIFVMNADGSDPQPLTSTSDWEVFPAWSPDGSQIAFTGLIPNSRNTDVFVMNADGSNLRKLTDIPGFDENPVWSPDGSQIAFQTSRDGDFEIYLMNSDGSHQRPVATNPADELWPSWSMPSIPKSSADLDDDGDRYLGQVPPGSQVEVFAPGVVSIEDGKEYKITFSPDLQEIFFVRRTPNGGNDRIWYSRIEDGSLTEPVLAPFTYDCFEMDPAFTPDGNRVYYNSQRPLPGEDSLSDRWNVWYVDRTPDGWSEPQFFGPPLNDSMPVYFSFADDNTMYFTNARPRMIRYAEWVDGQYTDIQSLPYAINYLPSVAHPAIAPDESYIVVDSYVEKGGMLVGSLYVSFRNPDGSWKEAVSLADALNATPQDIYAAPRITPDGKYLFFERYLPDTDQADLYWVSTDIFNQLIE